MLRIGAVVGFGKFGLPLLLGIFSGEGGNFIIKDRNSGVGRVIFPKEITFLDKGFSSWGKGRVIVFDEACRNRMLGSKKKYITESGFIFKAGG